MRMMRTVLAMGLIFAPLAQAVAQASNLAVFPARAAAGSATGDAALAQLLQGFAVLEGQLSHQPMANGVYRVQPGDTLDEIIYRTMGKLSVRHEVIREAFLQANPKAFRRRNPNYLLAGVELRIPGPEDFRAVVFDEPVASRRSDRRRMIRYP